MKMEWFEKFIDHLAKLLKEPPYLLFVFISAVFVITSLISQRYFDQTWIFFLYSVAGTMWRYIERDVRHNLLKENQKAKSIVVYHIGNLGLFFALLHYLGLL